MDINALLKVEVGLAWIVASLYGISFIIGLRGLLFHKGNGSNGMILVMKITACLHVLLVLLRAYEVQRLPLQTIYEAISFFAFLSSMVYLLINDKLIKKSSPGVLISGIAFSSFLYGLLGRDPFILTTFVKFNSQWFELHTLSAFLAYALLTVGFAIEICCGLPFKSRNSKPESFQAETNTETLAYKLTATAFPFLTLSILLGMLWAYDLWGVYWIWDPKLTWTFIMWIIYSAYLHSKSVSWLKGKPSSFLHVSAYLCLLFSFLGTDWFTTTLGTLQKCHMSL